MAGISGEDDGDITGINVTPLVDVMLVLLVIFMVTANYIVKQSINVNLPNAESGESITKTMSLAFTLDDRSLLYLNGKRITYKELPKAISKERAKSKKNTVQALIAADEKTPHGAVIELIDAVRKNGITDFAINVESKTK
jgi:biopolymer transport protein ExbD